VSARARTVSFTCRGHPGIAGTHDKTLELTRDASVTRRATCVLGVAGDYDDTELLALRGDVEVTLRCGEHHDAFTAAVTPFFLGGESLVFRRGPALRGRTFAGHAGTSAAGVDRALVEALARPDAVLDVEIRELGRGDRSGALFVVALPIGNDDDLSPRARRVLEVADVVLAEDTRVFRGLARRVGLTTGAAVLSYHDRNEAARAGDALGRIHNGARVALVSDAGTPLCSDPGYVLVRRAVDEGLAVSPVPGPSAMLAVLSASGLAVDRFTFVGFLPRRSAARRAELSRLADRRETFVVHEAPHRIAPLLADLAAVCPDAELCVGREVTKVFEEFRRGSARELASAFAGEEVRGELTIVVAPPRAREAGEAEAAEGEAGARVEAAGEEQIDRLLRALLAEGVTTKTLAQALARLPGTSRKAAYSRVLGLAAPR